MSDKASFLGHVHNMLTWLHANRGRDIDVQRDINPRLHGGDFLEWLDIINSYEAEANNPETWISILNVVSVSVHDLGTRPEPVPEAV